jgi:hypothetical protein
MKKVPNPRDRLKPRRWLQFGQAITIMILLPSNSCDGNSVYEMLSG